MRRLPAFVLCSCARSALPRAAPSPSPLAPAEATFLDFLDAHGAVGAIDSGLWPDFKGRSRESWDAAVKDRHRALTDQLAALDVEKLSPADQAALTAMRVTLADWGDPSPAVANTPDGPTCTDRDDPKLDYEGLSAALAACYREIGNNLKFEDGTIDRGGALGLWYDLEDPARRKALHDAFLPLWSALNGNNEPDSPYRRLIKLAADAEATNGSGPAAAARAIGVTVPEVEQWLVKILEAWRDATGPEMVEPWDYRFAIGEGGRRLAPSFPAGDILARRPPLLHATSASTSTRSASSTTSRRRPDKSPLAYTDFLTRGRYVPDGEWTKTIARVVGRYEDGGLSSLNELVHENGHAVHISAIRNRPAFTDWTDTIFTEAFADVPSWSVYEPAWQRKYLGTEIPVGLSLQRPARQRDDGHRLVAVRDPHAARPRAGPERAVDRHHARVPAHQAASRGRLVGRARAAREPAGVHGQLRPRLDPDRRDPQGHGRRDRPVRRRQRRTGTRGRARSCCASARRRAPSS